MTAEGTARGEPARSRAKGQQAELRAKIAELEHQLDDALLLKREVESQAETIRRLSVRVEQEYERAEVMTRHSDWADAEIAKLQKQLRILRSTPMYRAKVALSRALQSPSGGRGGARGSR